MGGAPTSGRGFHAVCAVFVKGVVSLNGRDFRLVGVTLGRGRGSAEHVGLPMMGVVIRNGRGFVSVGVVSVKGVARPELDPTHLGISQAPSMWGTGVCVARTRAPLYRLARPPAAGVCVLHNCIYAAGGYDGQYQLNSVERYDVETETWTFVAPMRHRRSALGITVHQGRIYVLGEVQGGLGETGMGGGEEGGKCGHATSSRIDICQVSSSLAGKGPSDSTVGGWFALHTRLTRVRSPASHLVP